MLAWLRSVFRRQPSLLPVPAVPDRVTIHEPQAAAPTLIGTLREVVTALGGPLRDAHPAEWAALVERISTQTGAMQRRPSTFPLIASQMIAMLRDPQVDLNKVVGAIQRDAATATALLKIANSPVFAPAVPISTLRGALLALGIRQVGELVIASAGRTLYEVPSRAEIAMFPHLWKSMFHDAMANAFTAGRIGLEVRGANSERALLAGLLIDVGRPIGLHLVATAMLDGMQRSDDFVVGAAIEETAPALGGTCVDAMRLPVELHAACRPDIQTPTIDGQIARLVAAIGTIQRRGPKVWPAASEVRLRAEQLELSPNTVRSLFGMRTTYLAQAASFG